MKKMNLRKKFSNALSFISILVVIIILFSFLGEEEKIDFDGQSREPWVTIFVHGSFGSLMGFLSVYNVWNDQVDGTHYKKVVGKMRKDPSFYGDQPLLQKGLVKIVPTFNLREVNNKKFAVYPFCKAYEALTEYVKPGVEKNYFYTFGWSGLLSQRRRQLEAIRFYNEVNSEIVKLHRRGIYPNVRVLTHSHAGNLIAYLGALHEVLSDDIPDQKDGSEREKILIGMKEKIDSLPDRKSVKRKKGQKKWDYRPEDGELEIDELVLWGMPVQPETDHLFASNIFKSVFHFYSDEDLVQRVDWVSTKQGYSNRRFDVKRLCTFCGKKNLFVQSRITVNRDLTKKKVVEKKVAKKESFWSVLFSGGSLVAPNGSDPTHKELWFFSWADGISKERKFVLAPLPVAVFSPLFTKLIEQKHDCHDLDINIVPTDKGVDFCLLKHNGDELQAQVCINKKFLASIEKKVKPWKTEHISSFNMIDMISKYVGG